MPCLDRPLRTFATGLLAASAALAQAQGTEADLVTRAQAWLAGRYQIQPASVGVHPMDPRVQSRGCEGGAWQFDQPFAGNEGMLRARCPHNNWQVFLKVMLPARPAAAVVANAPGQPPTMAPAPTQVATVAPAAMPVMPVIQAPALVKRGQTVLATWTPTAGLLISARMEALDDGRLGETIRLKNRDTGRIVSAVVNGQNTAQGL